MGFPLDRGSVHDGILTCHWHHARFDLCSGGTFDQWADDVQTYPVQEIDGDIYVDLTPRMDAAAHYRKRLHDGLERNIRLLIGKSVIGLLELADAVEPFKIGLEFGTTYRGAGWGQGSDHARLLHEHAQRTTRGGPCARLVPRPGCSRPRYGRHGATFYDRSAAATGADLPTLKRWFREFIEVRDDEGAERCVVSALRLGDRLAVADMLLAAATDHRYIQIGHVVDFINKALESLDHTGWEQAEPVLASLVRGIASANRMEESNAWRNPIDLIALLDATFADLPAAEAEGQTKSDAWDGHEPLALQLLEDDPAANLQAMLDALRAGASREDIARVVTHAAGMRVARFHTSNEFGDWDTVLHTFTYANALHQSMRRVPSSELLRGVFDAAMSVYLDRFLNMPAARIPEPRAKPGDTPENLLVGLMDLLDRQQQVNEAAGLVARYLGTGAAVQPLLATLGQALLREDRDFHTVQVVEAAISQYHLRTGTPSGATMLIACARYLAAHAPTARAQGQTYRIAERLHRGDRLFEGD